MRCVKEEVIFNNDHVMDFRSAVEGLHTLTSQELTKLLRDSENFTIQINTDKGPSIQVDMERLAWSLPLHLVAVLVSSNEDNANLRYLLCGIRLLHSMCDLTSRHSRLEQILLEDAKVTEQILDLVFYMLVVLVQYEQETHIKSHIPLLHSTLVACTLHLLTSYISSQWQDLVHVLLVHPKVDVFMDASLDVVRVDVRFFQMKLSALSNEVFLKKCSTRGAESIGLSLCQQCEASLQFLHSLCQQKQFRERLLRNKELCRNGSILSLARAVLKLSVPQQFKESVAILAAISRWKSKVLSILLQLCETESISYLDEVASSPRAMHLAKSVASEVLELLKAAFSEEPTDHKVFVDSTNPRGLVILNSMRLADIFSDDSNFRSFIMTNITQVLADILALPHDDFLANWCSTDLSLVEEDASLEYDPHNVAGVVLASLTEGPGVVFSLSNILKETNVACPFSLNNSAPVSHARHRTSFLVKIFANLHCFNPKICEEQEKDQFVNKFLECLKLKAFTAHKASTVCDNLRSLLDHAVSLIPSLLNEEDVQLLSEFFEQLRALFSSASFCDHPPQDPVVKGERDTQDEKFADSFLGHQSSLCWDKDSDIDLSEMFQSKPGASCHRSVCKHSPACGKKSPEEAQTTGGYGNAAEETRCSKERNDYQNEDTSKTSTFQEAGQLKATVMPMDLENDSADMDRTETKITLSSATSGSLKENEKDPSLAEGGSGSNPIKGRNCVDQKLDNGDVPNAEEHVKASDLKGMIQENDKAEPSQYEERQPRKRKRNIMNLKQIALIEKALLDEPEMQRNASLLQSWADKLSAHGSELTPSQLKNWLNNRKARLARAAREARPPSEGESAIPEKSCGSSKGNFYDSPESPGMKKSNSETEMVSPDFVDFPALQMNGTSLRHVRFEPGQYVSLVDGDGKEVGKGKIYQVEGRWQGKSLDEAGVCIVDVVELKVQRRTKIPHPSETAGATFDEAEIKNGVMRVSWDANKIYLIPK